MAPTPDSTSESTSTTDLIKEALSEARHLVQLEVGIAKAELKEELVQVKRAVIAGSIAFGMLLLMFAALLVALILALGGTVSVALITSGALLVLAVGLGAYAYAAAPKSLLGRTRQHLKEDAAELKEHVA